MSNYTKIVDYAAKDALNTGDPAKLVKGTEIGAEYDAISVAIATKANTASPAFTGVSGFAVGAVGAPSIYMTGYATTGWYNIGANNWGFAVSGAKVLDIASTGLSVAGTGTFTGAGSFRASATSSQLNIGRTGSLVGDGWIGADSANAFFCLNQATTARALQVTQTAADGTAVISSTGLAVTGAISATAISATGTSSLARIDQSNGSIDFASLGNGSTSWQIGTQTASKPLDIFTGGVVRAQFSDTGLAVTGALSATGNISATAGDVLIRGATGGQITQNTVAGGLYFANTGTSTDMRFYTTDGAGASVLALTLDNTTGLGEFANGLAVTGTLSATGTSSLARIEQSNGSIVFASLGNGSTSWQIGTQTAGKPLDLFIGGSVIATVSTTGLAVTGDISVSTKTPASAAAAGVAGTITWDASFLYVCTATDTWKRVAIATW